MDTDQGEITFQRIAGVRAIEDAAIRWVIELESAAGRTPVDRRGTKAFPGDIESPPRTIEVKAVGGAARGADLPLEVTQYERATSDPEFYLYLVDNIAQGDPAQFGLRVFGGAQLARLLGRARERRFYELPVGVAEYDAAPRSVRVPPGLAELAGLAAFLPEFTAPGFEFGKWVPPEEQPDGTFTMPWYALNERVIAFIEEAERLGWVRPEIDLRKWAGTAEAIRLLDQVEAAAEATPEQLAHLLTAIIREAHYGERTLAKHHDSGLLLRILRRAAVLASEAAT